MKYTIAHINMTQIATAVAQTFHLSSGNISFKISAPRLLPFPI